MPYVHQIPYIICRISAGNKTQTEKNNMHVQVHVSRRLGRFFLFDVIIYWQSVKIDGIALCQPRAVQVP